MVLLMAFVRIISIFGALLPWSNHKYYCSYMHKNESYG